jgi:hypothetical protein
MADVHGTIAKPVEEATDVLRRVAVEQGWTYQDAESGPARVVCTKGLNWFTWGSRLEVVVAPHESGGSLVTASTSEKFGWNDWGRGRRAATRLLETAGAEVLDEPPV